MQPLKRSLSFYRRPTKTVARELLGQILCRRLGDGTVLRARIVEVEAYQGLKDRACHTHGGRKSERTRPMWGAGGRAYVYLIYGMYDCLNVVTEAEGVPEAVLIRAAEPVEGHELWRREHPRLKERDWLRGPGRLARAMHVDRSFSGVSLTGDDLWIEKAPLLKPRQIGASARIGIDYAGAWAARPLRFFEKGSACVSGPKALNQTAKARKTRASKP